MKFTWSIVLGTLASCLFTGIIIISIGLGAAIPQIDLVARPFVCPNGEMKYEQQVYRPTPVETVTTTTWYCVEESTGVRRELGIFPMSLYSGTVYGLLLFPLALVGMGILGGRVAANFQTLRKPGDARAAEIRNRLGMSENPGKNPPKQASGDAVRRLKELNALREADLISAAEYEQKRAEILREV
jgi:hypothetical protein